MKTKTKDSMAVVQTEASGVEGVRSPWPFKVVLWLVGPPIAVVYAVFLGALWVYLLIKFRGGSK